MRVLPARIWCAWLVLGLFLAGPARAAAPHRAAAARRLAVPHRHAPRQPSSPTAVAVDGPELLKGGVPWIPRGVQIVGLVAPAGALGGKYVAANAHYSPAELAQAAADGADTVRFQVSQFGLDPDSSIYAPGYLTEIEQAVASARALGLVAIVSVQAEPPAGESSRCPLPDTGTERVWRLLAAAFGADPGVMFELYNEPAVAASRGGWLRWLAGGPVVETGGYTCQAIGMQALIDEIRTEQAVNVIIVPGLSGESTLNGMPPLVDPGDPQSPQLAYGVHYPSQGGGIAVWERAFGTLSALHPVIVTEWDANSTTGCRPGTPVTASLLLAYLASKGIGVVGFAFDLPGTIIADWSYAPTSYQAFACGTAGGGPGALLFGEFAGLAQGAAQPQVDDASADDPAPDDPPAITDPEGWIVDAGALSRVAALDEPLAVHVFDTPRTFVTGATAATVVTELTPAALPTASFPSEASLAAAVQDGTVPPGTRAVMLESSHSRLTPAAEQRHPASYYQRAAGVAHAAGLLLIAAPALSLVEAEAPRTPAPKLYSKFVALGIAGAAARYADVYAVQAQGEETRTAAYARFVRRASAQAEFAHPGVELLATVSTRPGGGRKPSGSALARAVLATEGTVSGYWLADPPSRATCQACGPWSPRVAVGMLSGLFPPTESPGD
jgi:Cellulase (glycosyl hydrolase family 5)